MENRSPVLVRCCLVAGDQIRIQAQHNNDKRENDKLKNRKKLVKYRK